MIDFICAAIVASELEMNLTKQALASLQTVWVERANFRAGRTSLRALLVLGYNPVVSGRFLAANLDVSHQAANVALTQLTQRVIVRRRKKHGKEFYYAAEEVLAVLAKPFGADTDLALAKGRSRLLENV